MARHVKKVLNKLFTKYLYVTNVVGVSCMLAAGDTIEQRFVERLIKDEVEEQDWDRTGRMFASGVSMGTVAHFWYGWLDRRYPGTALRVFIKKMAVDTVIGVPLTNLSWFYSIGLLEGLNARESAHSAVTKLPPIIVGELAFWTPAQAINFYFLPPKYRVMYLGVVSLAWTAFMSYVQYEYGKTDNTSGPKSDLTKSDLE